MKSAVIHFEAQAELEAAMAFYESRRARLGTELRLEFEASLARVLANPLAYTPDKGFRYCPLHRFPYSIVYVDFVDRIWVVAVAHHSRRPGYWRLRKSTS